MNRENIIRMAREAGFVEQSGFYDRMTCSDEQLERFSQLLGLQYQKKIADLENIICQRHWDVLQEREACAKVCDELMEASEPVSDEAGDWVLGTKDCSAAIRARG